VLQKRYEQKCRAEITTFYGTFHFGGMPQDMALKSLRLFTERVMPALKDL